MHDTKAGMGFVPTSPSSSSPLLGSSSTAPSHPTTRTSSSTSLAALATKDLEWLVFEVEWIFTRRAAKSLLLYLALALVVAPLAMLQFSSLTNVPPVPALDLSSTSNRRPPTVAIVVITTNERPYTFRALHTIQRYAHKHNYQLHTHFGLETIPNCPLDTPAVWAKLPAILDAMEKSDTGVKLGLAEAKWVWMLDLDVMITNSDIMLQELLPGFPEFDEGFLDNNNIETRTPEEKAKDDEAQVVISRDCRMLNFGSSFWRNSEWSKMVLKQMFEEGRRGKWESVEYFEQGMFNKYYEENAHGLANLTRIANQWEINSWVLRRSGAGYGCFGQISEVFWAFVRYPRQITCYQKKPEGRPWNRNDLVIHFPSACEFDSPQILMCERSEILPFIAVLGFLSLLQHERPLLYRGWFCLVSA